MTKSEAPIGKLLAAFAILYLVWGSTYIAIRFAIETLPPLLMAGVRFLLAGSLLYSFRRWQGVEAPPLRHWKSTGLVGALLLFAGNGGVVLAERLVPSALVALLVALMPLWMVLLEWLRPGGERPSQQTFVGLGIGILGMVLLVGPGRLGGGIAITGVLLVVAATMGWAAGSIYSRGADLPKDPLLTTSMQMLCGGACLLLAGLLRGEPATFDMAAVSLHSMLAFLYLTAFGSLLAFSAYVWLLRVSTPAKVSTYAYVNPVVAVFLGWWLGGESISLRVLLAAAVIIFAVIVMTTGKKTKA
jgi:drug/metabolite transporter (DMT)-like permease